MKFSCHAVTTQVGSEDLRFPHEDGENGSGLFIPHEHYTWPCAILSHTRTARGQENKEKIAIAPMTMCFCSVYRINVRGRSLSWKFDHQP